MRNRGPAKSARAYRPGPARHEALPGMPAGRSASGRLREVVDDRARAARAPTSGVSSSRVARRTPSTLPKRVSSALRRRAPMPGIASSSERKSRVARAWRWKVMAKRCASSRMRCSRRSAAPCGSSAIGRSLSRTKTSSSFLARPTATRFASPTLLERRVGRVQLPLAAVDHDQVGKRPAVLEHAAVAAADDLLHGGKVVEESRRRAGRSRGRRRVVSKCLQETRPLFEQLRESSGVRGTSGTRPASSGRPRRRPARPRSRCPGWSRCRSTRCGAAAPAAADAFQQFERVVVGRRRAVEAGAIGERGVALREIDQSFLSPRCGTTTRTLRSARDDSHASSTSLSIGSTGTWISGGGTWSA